jgi:spore germination protein YaaH
LGAHPVAEHLHLDSASTRASVLSAVGQVLDDGFDGVHLDFEPVREGDGDLVTLLRATHAITMQRHATLSISASYVEPLPGMAVCLAQLPRQLGLWSGGYLHQLAQHVDQVALMAYDTWTWTSATYGGYVRRAVVIALAEVPSEVGLLIGVPAYHDDNLRHHRHAETVAAAIRGIRLALGPHPPRREFGVAMYVDFAATDEDWSSYRRDWANVTALGERHRTGRPNGLALGRRSV